MAAAALVVAIWALIHAHYVGSELAESQRAQIEINKQQAEMNKLLQRRR